MNDKMTLYIGLDVGGTKIEGILVNKNLKVVKRIKRLTEAWKSRERIVENIASVVKELETKSVAGVGIGIPGFVDSEGRQRLTPNIKKFENFELKKALEKKLKRKICLENDAHCFVLAEQQTGAAKGMKNVLGLTLGTGIGGGAIIDGKLYRGKNGGAAHFGHMIIDVRGDKCECGKKGDLEAWCGGKYMEKRYKAITGKHITAKEIFENKNKAAAKILADFYQKLGMAIVNLVNAFNPEGVVLGGSISNAMNMKRLQKEINNYTNPLISETKIMKNKLGSAAGVYGAALLVH